MPYIYKIINTKNENYYIGSTKNFRVRFSAHKSRLRGDYHPNNRLQSDWNKFGESCFVFSVIEECENGMEREQQFLDSLHPPYNILTSVTYSDVGLHHTEEHKKRISQKLTGIKRSLMTKFLISQSRVGDKHHNKKLLDVEIGEIRKIWNFGNYKQWKIAKAYGISQPYLSRLVNGVRRASAL